MIDVQDIYNQLLARHFQEELFRELNLKGKGKDLMGECPFCQSSRFSVSMTKPLWHCWSCGESGDWISYLYKRENKNFIEAVKELADLAGVEIELNPDREQKYQETRRRNSLFEEIQQLFVDVLPQSQGFQYLQTRGYDTAQIKTMGLGAYPTLEEVTAYLQKKGFSPEEIKSSGLINRQLEARISIPYPNQAGVLTGFAFRANEEQLKPKYLYTKGLKKGDSLVGYQFRPYQPLRVLIVEGLIDALLLNTLGLKDYWILALGGASLSKKQVQVIADSGIQEVLLCLDNDEAGEKGTEISIELLRQSNLRIYCFDWQSLVSLSQQTGISFKDPDEVIRYRGIEWFRYCLEYSQSWSQWLANYLYNKYAVGTSLGNDGYINQCLEVESTISDPLERRQFQRVYLDQIASEGITEDDIALRKKEKLNKTSRSKSIKAIINLQKTLTQLIQSDAQIDLLKSEEAIESGLTELQKSRGVELPQPYLFSDVLLDVDKIGEGLTTGYQDLDELCLIPTGAITLVSARPSIGKTTFMLNLLLNQINHYPARSFYFFSYEESKSRLAIKIIQNLAGEILSEKFNHNAYINYLKYQRPEGRYNDKIEEGIRKFEELVNAGRLWLLDKRLNDKDLVTTLTMFGDTGNIGAVYIDYVQKIPPHNSTNQDWLNIKNVSQTILDCAVNLDIPIILGCQLNRATESRSNKRPTLGDLRQSGDLEQDANLVLGLYRDEFYNQDSHDLGIIEVSTLKNRNGVTGGVARLEFFPESLKIANTSVYAHNYQYYSNQGEDDLNNVF